jgi:hypothetical protein
MMLKGDYESAVSILQPWREVCSYKSALGAATLLDLAAAYEA